MRPAIHPGEILEEELAEIGMTAAQLADLINVPANRLYQIIQGKRNISADTALRLGRWFGTGAGLWMNLQKNYELRLAEIEAGEAIAQIKPREVA
ncbi:MAG: HigA family addiction module antitoxin [Aquisalinus sp.]|nr:HigA family addiction module antitoxin [Aquisalinus sp.]